MNTVQALLVQNKLSANIFHPICYLILQTVASYRYLHKVLNQRLLVGELPSNVVYLAANFPT